ncbi:ATP-binding protein [Burkholderia gladioli]|uniref:ATP-binding protein n=1 Tax=Burkholderia gladioli TaxID=28095 RepID=UPI001FCA3F86|nr:ATP-binding protein [Burkholderia gladioli]
MAARIPRSDEPVLSHYISSVARWAAFWFYLAESDASSAKRRRMYAFALDYQLLSAYDPQWTKLVYDADALMAICPEWSRIVEWLEAKFPAERKKKYERELLGVFMLWPRILSDLDRWNSLDNEQKIRLAHAAFALSSVAATDWFVQDALRRQHGLEAEFSGMLSNTDSNEDNSRFKSVGETSDAVDTSEEAWQSEWSGLLTRLDSLRERLGQEPNGETVASLRSLCAELDSAIERMPDADEAVLATIDGLIAQLSSLWKDLQSEAPFGWLVDELVEQVLARWQIAKDASIDGDALRALAEDAGRVCERVEEGARLYREAWLARESQNDAVNATAEQLRATKVPTERRALERKKAEGSRRLLDAEDALPPLEDALLTCASPFEQAFDHDADYHASSDEAVEPDEPAESIEPKACEDTESSAEVPPAEPEIDDEAPSTEVSAEESQAMTRAASVEEPSDVPVTVPVIEAITFTDDPTKMAPSHDVVTERAPDESTSDDVTRLCAPVWTLLNSQHFGLVYQYATALSAQTPGLPMPPSSLLAAITLASKLVLPDGSIRESLPTHLNDLSQEAFEHSGEAGLSTTLNLLLVAATLRPMVLVPSVGAATAAGYVHLSNHPRLYEFVQELRGLSEKLQGFRIELATIKAARTEAGAQMELEKLQRNAAEWLEVHAPAMTMKFAAATNVWRHWTKPQGKLHELVSPIALQKPASLQDVRKLVAELTDPVDFLRLVRETDRKDLRRTRGEDIHSGALSQLERCVGEAVQLASRWISLMESGGQNGSRLRALLNDVRLILDRSALSVADELGECESSEPLQVRAAKSAVLAEIRAMQALFDPAAPLPSAEPLAAEVLTRDVLLIPDLHLSERWEVQGTPESVVSSIMAWAEAPEDWEHAFRARVARGDLFGAELIARDYPESHVAERWMADLKRERESWLLDLGRNIDDARREVEVGRAYGYLNDEDLGQFETKLVRCKAHAEQAGKVDAALETVKSVRDALEHHRTLRTNQVRSALADIRRDERAEEGIVEVEKVLALGDVATANELLHRLRDGKPVWPEGHASNDLFADFFPAVEQTLDAWLQANTARAQIEHAMRTGQSVGPLDFQRLGGVHREQAARLVATWSQMKSRKRAEATQLEAFFMGLGFSFKRIVSAGDRASTREVWNLDLAQIEDRTVCPVPHFGSMAKGRYRVICVWEQPAEEEILQLVGDSTLQKPTIVLYFARMKNHRWRELSRLAKTMRKTFLVFDEVMLVYLAAQVSKFSGFFQLALPFAYSTPYDATAGLVPPEMFYGRSAELDAVKGLNGRCFIYGGRQLGKTALLRRAEQSFQAPEAGRFSRWIDLRAEGIGVSRQAGDLWVSLAEHLKAIKVFDASVPVPTPSRKGGNEAVVQELRNFLNEDSDRRILLLLDEADRFFEQDGKNDFAETRRLKQLMDDTARRFKVVFAGLHNVLRMTERANHPLAHFGEPIKVGPLTDDDEIREAEDLVRRPMAAAGFSFESRSLVIRVLAQTNYYPSLIQLYCSHLLRHMHARMGTIQRQNGPRFVITDKDIESVYSSGALRDEIRSKFRLTLQLDPRYEVVAYALALAALRGQFEHAAGMNWKTIRERGALYWWPEGFKDTSELDFRVLLDEMVELGVLSKVRDRDYTLRNPNVLLLLGSQDEIEAVLIRDREPAVEFELASFRPPLKSVPSSPVCNPLTYQQLSELMRRQNSVRALAGSEAGGIMQIAETMRDYVGETAGVIVLNDCPDTASFTRSLDQALKVRVTEGNTLVIVPSSVPWSSGWIHAAERKLQMLRSPSKFVSLVFLADPVTLWSAIGDRSTFAAMSEPWMSLLPWSDEFVKHWLAEQQLPSEKETRQQIRQVTGYWGFALQELVGNCREQRELKRRIDNGNLALLDADGLQALAQRLGLTVREPRVVLQALVQWGVPATAAELSELVECSLDKVEEVLRWGDLLGLVFREGGDYWKLDPFISDLLKRLHS